MKPRLLLTCGSQTSDQFKSNCSTHTNLAVGGLISCQVVALLFTKCMEGGCIEMWIGVVSVIACDGQGQHQGDVILHPMQPPRNLPLILAQSFVSEKSNATIVS